MNITERQKEILMAIIHEFMTSADEVGSLALVEKYDLGVSSATIRNEMAKLMKLGLLEKSHVSSGRIPTDQAIRFYVTQSINGRNLSPLAIIEIRQGIFRERFNKEDAVRAILKILAKETESVVFLILEGDIRFYGLSNLLKYDEFKDIEKIIGIVNILEDESFLNNMAEKYVGSGVSLLIGEECGSNNLEDCALAFVKIPFWGKRESYVGILGAKRMDYTKVVPVLREVKTALENSMAGWR